MKKKKSKVCSTPTKVESTSNSISLSPIKNSSTDNICDEGVERADFKVKNRKRKRYSRKFRDLVRKCKGKISTELYTSSNKWEDRRSLDKNSNKKDEVTSVQRLFESPERVRDLGVEKNYELSPPLIGPRETNLPPIENEAGDKEEETLSLGKNKIEADGFSPIFDRSKDVRSYASTKNKKLQNYFTNPPVEVTHLRINDIDDENNAADAYRVDILDTLDEGRRKHLKSKRICKITGRISRRSGIKPVKIKEMVYVSDDDDLTSNVDADKRKRRRGKWIVEEIEEYDYAPSTTDNSDSNVQKEEDKGMTFNEFHSKCKRKKCNVQIKSVEKQNVIVYKRSDDNFVIKNYPKTSSTQNVKKKM